MENKKNNKKNKNNNSSYSLVFGRWPQTKSQIKSFRYPTRTLSLTFLLQQRWKRVLQVGFRTSH